MQGQEVVVMDDACKVRQNSVDTRGKVEKCEFLYGGKNKKFTDLTEVQCKEAFLYGWQDQMKKVTGYDALVWENVKHFRVQSLNEDFYTFDGVIYPFYSTLRDESDLDECGEMTYEQKNLLKMLLTTLAPLPRKYYHLYGLYSFEVQCEVVDLDFLERSVYMDEGRDDVTYHMLANGTYGKEQKGSGEFDFQAVREKIDGRRYIKCRVAGKDILVGSGWMPCWADVEVVERTERGLYVLYPETFEDVIIGVYSFISHPWLPYSVYVKGEGTMVLISGKEYRMKQEPTVEVSSKILGWRRDVSVEVVSRKGELVAVRERPDKSILLDEGDALKYLQGTPSASVLPVADIAKSFEISRVQDIVVPFRIKTHRSLCVWGGELVSIMSFKWRKVEVGSVTRIKNCVHSKEAGSYTAEYSREVGPSVRVVDVSSMPVPRYIQAFVYRDFVVSDDWDKAYFVRTGRTISSFMIFAVKGETNIPATPDLPMEVILFLNRSVDPGKCRELPPEFVVVDEHGKRKFVDDVLNKVASKFKIPLGGEYECQRMQYIEKLKDDANQEFRKKMRMSVDQFQTLSILPCSTWGSGVSLVKPTGKHKSKGQKTVKCEPFRRTDAGPTLNGVLAPTPIPTPTLSTIAASSLGKGAGVGRGHRGKVSKWKVKD